MKNNKEHKNKTNKSVKFYTAASINRPKRLPEYLRKWAWIALHGKYGDEAMKTYAVSIDDVIDFDNLSPIKKYDAAIRCVVEKAPIRICKEELICGSATLGASMHHAIPVTRNGQIIMGSVSHLTIRYDKMIKEGMSGYERDIDDRLSVAKEDEIEFLTSLKNVITCMRHLHKKYLEKAKQLGRKDLYELLLKVPENGATTFHEAVQSLWFQFAFVRLCGNWPGIGRIDELLGDYLHNDLKEGKITLKKAREILASMFVKGSEWICSNTPRLTGDAQFYQNLILAGIDMNGHEITNEVTYLVLDIVEELPIADFPISVRINSKTPKKLLNKVARVIRHGGGVVAIYNEELVIRSLVRSGYNLNDARRFANDGCWEVQIPGETNFAYTPFDSLQCFNKALGISENTTIPTCNSIDDVYRYFIDEIEKQVDNVYNNIINCYVKYNNKWKLANENEGPHSVISLFETGCLENARSYFDLGPNYFVRSPHIGGAPDVANSLYAIERLVFVEKKCSFKELINIIKDDWDGYEELRLYVKNRFSYYGNDNDECDSYLVRMLDDFATLVEKISKKYAHLEFPLRFIPGVSTFGRQVDWLPQRYAVAFGLKKGTILSGNDSPTPGTDATGATSIIKSYCKAPLEKLTCGAALDIKIFPETLRGKDGVVALVNLLKGFVKLNGYFMQIDTVDVNTLLKAQENPQEYKTLSVRVSGWNARFVTLKKEWQDMIIERTSQGM